MNERTEKIILSTGKEVEIEFRSAEGKIVRFLNNPGQGLSMREAMEIVDIGNAPCSKRLKSISFKGGSFFVLRIGLLMLSFALNLKDT